MAVFHLDKISLSFVKILRFFNMCTTARYSTQPWAIWIQFTSIYSILIPILTLPFRLYVSLPSSLCHLVFRHLCHSCYTVNPSHPPWYGHPYNVWRTVRIMKFPNTQFPPSSCYNVPLSSKPPWALCNQTVCVLPFHGHTKQTLDVNIIRANEEKGESAYIWQNKLNNEEKF